MATAPMTDAEVLKAIAELVKKPYNKECFDCGDKGPGYVCLNEGVFVCNGVPARARAARARARAHAARARRARGDRRSARPPTHPRAQAARSTTDTSRTARRACPCPSSRPRTWRT